MFTRLTLSANATIAFLMRSMYAILGPVDLVAALTGMFVVRGRCV